VVVVLLQLFTSVYDIRTAWFLAADAMLAFEDCVWYFSVHKLACMHTVHCCCSQVYIIVYGNLQAFSTNLYKKGTDGVLGRPKSDSVSKWAIACAVSPALTGSLLYYTHNVQHNKSATTAVLCIGMLAFAAMFAVNSSIHSYLIVSYSDKDKVR
jgi:hypothetical protein